MTYAIPLQDSLLRNPLVKLILKFCDLLPDCIKALVSGESVGSVNVAEVVCDSEQHNPTEGHIEPTKNDPVGH